MKVSIPEAVEIRKRVLEETKRHSHKRRVIQNILYGRYDTRDGDQFNVDIESAIEDYDFLEKDRIEWEQNKK